MIISAMKRLAIIGLLGLGLLALAGTHPARVGAAVATAPLRQASCILPATVTTATELADCITEANANGAGLDTITLGADITLSATLPNITSAITIEGDGFFVSGDNARRVFYVTNSGSLTLNRITVQNGVAPNGAGIYNSGGTVRVTNSTIANNAAVAPDDVADGGGILSVNGTLIVTHSTIAGNSVNGRFRVGSGIHIASFGTAYLAGTIFADNNGAANCEVSGSFGAIVGNGYNISDDGSCGGGTGSLTNANLNLSAFSGGVYTPQTGSDAIGVIPNGTTINNNGVTLACNGTTTDQLGNNRPIVGGDPCTSGAVEVTPLCILPATVTTATELADCITEANANGAGLDTISLGADITLSAALPQITSAITLEGAGYHVDGANTHRVFEVISTGNLTVNQLTVQNGNQTIGGGIYNRSGTLTVTNSTLSGNNANAGGGIYSDGTLTVTNSTLSTNNAFDGGGIYVSGGTLMVTNSTFSANSATSGEGGGGIYNGGGTVTATHTTFADNNAAAGGGIFNDGTLYLAGVILDAGTNGTNCAGGLSDNGYNLSDDASCGFSSGTSANSATLNLSALSVTTTPGQQVHTPAEPSDAIGVIPNGTTVDNNGVTLACNGTITDQLGNSRPADTLGIGPCTSGAVEVAVDLCPTPLAISDTAELANCITWANANPGADTLGLDADITLSAALPQITSAITLEGANFYVDGASTYRVFYVTGTGNLTVNQITVQNGFTSANGGGIYNEGTLTVTNSTFSGNSSQNSGSGIYSKIGTTTVTNSTFSGNSSSYLGGGISNYIGTLTVTHSTFSGNSSYDGDGIFNQSGGTLTLTYSTFSGNSGRDTGFYNSGVAHLAGVILDTGVRGSNCRNSGTLNDNGYNLSDDASCGFSSGTSANSATLNLSALSVTTTPGQQVHTPAEPSDAIGVIPNGTTVDNNGVTLACNGTITDQLGSNRPINAGGDCTAGAVEVALGTIIVEKQTNPAGATDSFTFTGDASGSITDGQRITVTNLTAGTYTSTETAPAGWDLTAIVCDDGNSSGDTGTATATFNLEAGETVTCVFTNTQRGTIIVEKQTVPAGATDSFTFTGSGAIGGFTLKDGEQQSFSVNAGAGPYTLTESDPGGARYEVTDIRCVNTQTGAVTLGDVGVRAVELDIQPGESQHCTFINEKIQGDPVVRITESYLVTRVEEGKFMGEGSVACYWITLNSFGSQGDVVVNIGQPANGQVTVDKSSVTLNSSNWNNLTLGDRSNFVCVRPIDDKIADGGTQICRDGNTGMTGQGSMVTDKECGDHTDSIPHSITQATAPGYSTSTPIERLLPDGISTVQDPIVPVLIEDNDTAGVVLTESYGVTDVDEDGTPVTVSCYWVTLLSQPTGEVTVTPLPDSQVTVQPSQIVLNHLTWNGLGAESNKLCVYPVQDTFVEGTLNQVCADKKVDLYGAGAVDTQVCGSHLGKVDHAFSSSDAKYNGNGVPVTGNGPDFSTGPRVIDVLIRDDETPGLVFTPAAINVLEGGAASYNVALRSQPTQNVAVTALDSNVTAAGVDATPLSFTPQNWNVPQAVNLTVPDDSDVNGIRTGGIGHNVSSGDSAYNGLTGAPVTLPMTITDDDAAGAALSRGSVVVAEGGASDSYAVRLTIQPTADVVVTVDGSGQVNAGPAQLTFTPSNWNVEQTVTVTAIDDAVDEGALANATVRHTASSSDPAYNGAAIAELLAEITDNDTAALAVGNAAVSSIAEGASTTYGLALATQPTGPVQVFVVTDGKTSANPAALSFDASNWNVAQVVTLTGVDDDVDNAANVRTSLVNHAAVSGDAAYNGVIDEGLSVDVVDNDVAAIHFTERNVAVAKGGQAIVGVTLATRPLATVVVELKPSAGVTVAAGCAEASEGVSQCLVFTPDNWNFAQTLTLTALTDAPEFIDHLAASADEGYNGLGARLNVNGADQENSVFLPLVVKQ